VEEGEARRRDVPRRRVLADESGARDRRSKARERGGAASRARLEWKAGGGSSSAVLAIVRDALALPIRCSRRPPIAPRGNGDRSSVVAPPRRPREVPVAGPPVAPEVLTNADELERLADGEREGVAVLVGWRLDLLGKELLALLDGRLSLVIHRGHVAVEARDVVK